LIWGVALGFRWFATLLSKALGSQVSTHRAGKSSALDATSRRAEFMLADMASVHFDPETFDAISAFYSITHLPKSEHAALIANWLRPGGRFLASYGTAEGDWSGEWLGTTMFFSHHNPETTKQLIQDAGLRLERVELLKQNNEEAVFLWITAKES
jgi:cyclopropane fatty-acyl-phospholipid synthase-like methyltransferase